LLRPWGDGGWKGKLEDLGRQQSSGREQELVQRKAIRLCCSGAWVGVGGEIAKLRFWGWKEKGAAEGVVGGRVVNQTPRWGERRSGRSREYGLEV